MQEVIHFLRELNCVRVAIVVQCLGLLLLHVVLHFSKRQVQKHTVLIVEDLYFLYNNLQRV